MRRGIKTFRVWRSAWVLLALLGLLGCGPKRSPLKLLNASYDATRAFYRDYDAAFERYWRSKTGQSVRVLQSHAGSGAQARAVIDGLPADVVTLASAADIDAIARVGHRLATNWQQRLPDHSAPYTSTIIFLVRKGNPKHIRDWDDLVRPGIQVITPNPKTSGGARWNYLAAYGYALHKYHGKNARARAFVAQLFRHVPVLATSARDATTTFVNQGLGDVLIAWESEALLAMHQLGRGRFDIVVPSLTILAEPAVAVVDRVARRRGTEALARAYLEYLYSEKGQELAAQHYFRPRLKSVARQYAAQFPQVHTFTIDQMFGGWAQADKVHFGPNGVFDQITSGKPLD